MTAEGLPRRDLFKISLLGAAALALPLERVVRAKSISLIDKDDLPRPYTVPFTTPPVLAPRSTDGLTDYYEITQAAATASILPGYSTPVFAYNGSVPGPTIRVSPGRRTVVRQINALPAAHPKLGYVPWTSTHLHGAASRPEYDGYASDITRPGEWKDYYYSSTQAARTLWYHDHGVGHTAENVYSGLAGLYLMEDTLERALALPRGAYDVPLMLGDAQFAADGSFMYDDRLHSGLYGDVNLVNGRPWPVMRVARRKYRFRILNASISRGYRLFLSTGDAMHVVATDGGLTAAPIPVTEIRMGTAERYEVVIDFAKYPVGTRIELRNRGVENAVHYDHSGKVMAFRVTDDGFDPSFNELPTVLNPDNPTMALTAAQATKTRKFRVKKDDDGTWEIAGMTWQDVVDSDYRRTFANPEPNAIEIWEIENSSGGWFHPVHVHLVDFKILARRGGINRVRPEENGPKDTVYVGEGETVRLVMKFEHQTGLYMIHCHNLPHEDHDMMTQFEVGRDGPSPFAAPAQPLPAPPLPGTTV